MARLLFFLAALAAACSCFARDASAFQMPSPVAEAKGVRSEVKYIACEACEALARHASEAISKLREDKRREASEKEDKATTSKPSRFQRNAPPAGSVTEAEILEAVEGMADPDSEHGEWITHYDLEVDGSRLRLVDKGERGKCGAKCRTVSMAASDVLEGTDTDLAERLWKGGEGAEPGPLASWLCGEATSACGESGKSPTLPARFKLSDDAPFEPESSEDAQIRKMMASMRSQGMGGQMFDRKSVLKSLKDDDDEDDDNEVEEKASDERDKADADAAARRALEELEEEEAEKEKEGAAPSAPSAPSAAAAAEKAAAVAGKGIAAARGWLSAKKELLLSKASSSSAKKSTAEL